jgi:hypothetical protein
MAKIYWKMEAKPKKRRISSLYVLKDILINDDFQNDSLAAM